MNRENEISLITNYIGLKSKNIKIELDNLFEEIISFLNDFQKK